MNAITLRNPVEVAGLGLHSGEKTTLRLLPEHEGRGLRFIRVDRSPAVLIHSCDIDIKAPQFRTGLSAGGAEVHTIEHLFSAFAGLGITDCTIEIDGAEVPGMDGSSSDFVAALKQAGSVKLDRVVEPIRIAERIFIQDGPASIEALPHDGALCIDYELNYVDHPLAQGRYEFTLTPEAYIRDVSRARTFATRPDAEKMRAAGFGKGANTDNTVIVDGANAVETQLRYPNEPVRHKVLDLIGDLYVLNRPLEARIVARYSGHRTNRLLALEILKRSSGAAHA